MKQFRLLTNIVAQLSTALAVFVTRLNFLPANISPLGSFGFFGNPILFALSILAFDLFVKGYYPGAWLTYLGFAAYPVLGYLSRNRTRVQLFALPTASFAFFVLSNLGVWWYWFDHTLADLMLCYTLAIPFYARTLASDLGFGYGYLLVTHRQAVRRYLTISHVYVKTT